MSAQRCCTAWNCPMGLPNCLRALAYSTAISMMRCMPPTISATSATVATRSARAIADRQEVLCVDWDVCKRNLVEFARFIDGGEWGNRQSACAAGHDEQPEFRAATRGANQKIGGGGIRHEHLPAI